MANNVKAKITMKQPVKTTQVKPTATKTEELKETIKDAFLDETLKNEASFPAFQETKSEEVDTKSGLSEEEIDRTEIKAIRFKFKDFVSLQTTDNKFNLVLYTVLRLNDLGKLNFTEQELAPLKQDINTATRAKLLSDFILKKCNETEGYQFGNSIASTQMIAKFMVHLIARLHEFDHIHLTPQDKENIRKASLENRSHDMIKMFYESLIYYSNLNPEFTLIEKDYWNKLPNQFRDLLTVNTNELFL